MFFEFIRHKFDLDPVTFNCWDRFLRPFVPASDSKVHKVNLSKVAVTSIRTLELGCCYVRPLRFTGKVGAGEQTHNIDIFSVVFSIQSTT